MKNYKQFFGLLKDTGMTKEEAVLTFTEGKHDSLRKLSQKDFQTLCNQLVKLTSTRTFTPADAKADSMRKAIISIFYQMDYKEPIKAAKAWAEKQGVNGEKKKFNDYNRQELKALILRAEKALSDYENALRKGLQRLEYNEH